jgi:hypothetical protein
MSEKSHVGQFKAVDLLLPLPLFSPFLEYLLSIERRSGITVLSLEGKLIPLFI